jgi:hypothetical protein
MPLSVNEAAGNGNGVGNGVVVGADASHARPR